MIDIFSLKVHQIATFIPSIIRYRGLADKDETKRWVISSAISSINTPVIRPYQMKSDRIESLD